MAGWISKLVSKPKSTQEIEEETEHLEAEERQAGVELSLTQKRLAAKMLKERGLQPSNFGNTGDANTWAKIIQWLKSH